MTAPSATGLDVGTRLAVDRTRLAHERTVISLLGILAFVAVVLRS